MMILRIIEVIAMVVGTIYALLTILSLIYRLWNSRHVKWIPILLVVATPSIALADIETRATELGTAAKCSQTWNSTIAKDSGNSFGWHQVTAPDKPCLFDANIEMLWGHSNADLVAGTAGTHPDVFNALPAGYTTTRVLVFPNGYSDQAEGGWTGNAQIRTQGRWAYRWYIYYSSNYPTYAFPAGPCTNSSKFFTVQPSYLQMTHQADLQTPQVYGWAVPPDSLAWQPDVSPCCWFGPGYDTAAAADGALPGSWWRYEVIGHGMDGTPGAYIKVYRKNVTTNSPDRKIVDTTIDCIDCDGDTWDWPSDAKTALQSPANMNMVTNNFYRAGTCAGYIATAYALFAQWDTDADQRIGAAVEMEGSGAVPPAAIVMFIEWAVGIMSVGWHFRTQLLSATLAVASIGGTVWGTTKTLTYHSAQKMAQVYLDYSQKESDGDV